MLRLGSAGRSTQKGGNVAKDLRLNEWAHQRHQPMIMFNAASWGHSLTYLSLLGSVVNPIRNLPVGMVSIPTISGEIGHVLILGLPYFTLQ